MREIANELRVSASMESKHLSVPPIGEGAVSLYGRKIPGKQL